VEMVRELCPVFSLDDYLAGVQTPVFFGSAVNTFGVQELLKGVGEFAPSPRAGKGVERDVLPSEKKVSAFVFKIQANMDPKHRDRIAFVRLVSGKFKKGMKLKHVRSGKIMSVHNAQLFLAQDREIAEEAYAGDIMGIPNHGNLRIGDSLTEGEIIHFTGVPSFAPEMLQKVRSEDPMKAKHLGRALEQLAEEGAASVFKPNLGSDWVVGVVGSLQFDVLADRIRTEYQIPVKFEATSLMTAEWIEGDAREVKLFTDHNRASMAIDHSGAPVYLARNSWHLDKAKDDYPSLKFLRIKEETI